MEWFEELLKQKRILKTSWFMQDGAGRLSVIIRRVVSGTAEKIPV